MNMLVGSLVLTAVASVWLFAASVAGSGEACVGRMGADAGETVGQQVSPGQRTATDRRRTGSEWR